jgi:hypothetical protein
MGTYLDKQPASRIIKTQNLAWTGSGTVVSTNFATQTYQVRVCAQTAGWINIDSVGQSSTVPTTAGGAGAFVPASTVGGEYFVVTPGMVLSFASTTTSTGSPWVSVSEMA